MHFSAVTFQFSSPGSGRENECGSTRIKIHNPAIRTVVQERAVVQENTSYRLVDGGLLEDILQRTGHLQVLVLQGQGVR